jgi:uncharacterized membrane protein
MKEGSIFVSNIVEIDPYSPFGIFLSYLFLFMVGSFLGYLLEVLFRRFVSMKRWMNPGFLKGPCLPLYGIGTCALYFLSNTSFDYLLSPTSRATTDFFYGERIYSSEGFLSPSGSLPFYAVSIIAILLIGAAMTLIEFIAGLIFVKGLRIRLWNYSKLKGNIMGIICPLFSLIWAGVGAIYRFALRPLVNYLVYISVPEIRVVTFLIGIYYGILIIDFIYSMKLTIKVTGMAYQNKFVVDFQKLRNNLAKKEFKSKKIVDLKATISTSLSPVKEKLSDAINKAKAHMYINNELPEESPSRKDETPRTKAKEDKK